MEIVFTLVNNVVIIRRKMNGLIRYSITCCCLSLRILVIDFHSNEHETCLIREKRSHFSIGRGDRLDVGAQKEKENEDESRTKEYNDFGWNNFWKYVDGRFSSNFHALFFV